MWLRTKNGYDFQVDEEDVALASEPGWCGHISGYRRTNGEYGRRRRYLIRFIWENGKRRTEYLHRKILNAPSNMQVDHKNSDTLDFRRDNLRLCTPAQNQANKMLSIHNTSGAKGVCWYKQYQKWHVRVVLNRKCHHFGYFIEKKDAIIAYNNAAVELFGEFARLNDT